VVCLLHIEPSMRAFIEATRRGAGAAISGLAADLKWTPHRLSMVKLLWFASYGVS